MSVYKNFSSFQVLTYSFQIKLLAVSVSTLQFEFLIEQRAWLYNLHITASSSVWIQHKEQIVSYLLGLQLTVA